MSWHAAKTLFLAEPRNLKDPQKGAKVSCHAGKTAISKPPNKPVLAWEREACFFWSSLLCVSQKSFKRHQKAPKDSPDEPSPRRARRIPKATKRMPEASQKDTKMC